MRTYTVEQARQMCELCYGKSISDRTWRKWRKTLGMGCKEHQIKWLTERQAIWIAGYAYLKRRQPNGKHTLTDVIKMLENHPRLYQIFYSVPTTTEGFYGKELPAIIEKMTGRKVSLRTIYRIAENKKIDFSVNTIYSINILNIFLSDSSLSTS